MAIFVLCLTAFAALLYQAQVVRYEDYLSRSTTQVTHTETVEASRGILTDRNGKVLVTNRQVYTITFDPEEVPESEDPSVTHDQLVGEAVLRLIRLCEAHGVTWEDNLPLTRTAPYSYTTGQVEGVYRTRFQRYLSDRGWSASELTAEDPYPRMPAELQVELGAATDLLPSEELLRLMRQDFGLGESMTDREARLVLGVLYELEIRQIVNTNAYIFAEDVSVELISILTDGGFDGVVIGSESVRQYNTDHASHLLGRVGPIYSAEELEALNAPYETAKSAAEEAGKIFDTDSVYRYRSDDMVGKDGSEHAFESYLRGKDGQRVVTTNEEGKITGELYSDAPEPGCTVALTIDIDFQAEVERFLAEATEAMNAEDGLTTRGAAAAVVSVESSDVLALATYPTYSQRSYDLTALENDEGAPMFNRALNGTYPPGSTFKMCTAVAGLETGFLTPTSTILTRGRYMYYYNPNPAASYTPVCWLYNQSGGSHGRINVSEAIYHSCNYFFYEVGRLVGISALDEYAAAFGLGQPTGIELPERTGTLAGPAYSASRGQHWYDGNTLQAAIGQSDNTFTPLQLANYVATLVRGGTRYEAHLLHSVQSYDGRETLYEYTPQVAATVEMSEATLQAVKKGMGDLVTKGSISRYFQDCVVTAGAKTGSAQTGEEVANGVFVCFAPFDEPEIAVAIVIEKGGSGAALAATAVNIINSYFSGGDIGALMIPEGELLP